jgi:outer membrane protein
VPVYQGGSEYATVRQAKETLSQRRIDLDTARDQAQQTLVQSWGQLEAAKAQIQATQSQVTSAEIALNGVREEARVGQRTTLDVPIYDPSVHYHQVRDTWFGLRTPDGK